MTALAFTVVGTPAPQGSKRHVGHGILVESSKKVRPWRQDVKAAALTAREADEHDTFTGPVEVSITFELARPRYHYRTGRFANLLRDNAPALSDRKPDVDKLVRSTLDALKEAAVYRDDSQVALLVARKQYANVGPAGAIVVVRTAS